MRIRLPNGSSFRPEDLEEDLANKILDGEMTADQFMEAIKFSGVPYSREELLDLYDKAKTIEESGTSRSIY